MPENTNRRHFLKSMGMGAIMASIPFMNSNCQKTKQPNILFCITDDQSWVHASAYGCKFVHTPAFDRVANEGILFKHAFVSAPSCCPSRGSVLTGQAFYRLEEASMNHTIWPNKFKVYPDILEKNGYFIGYTGKGWGPGQFKRQGRMHNPAGPAFNDIRTTPPAEGMNTIDYAANFNAFLESRPDNSPFCFWVGITEPHLVYERGSGAKLGKNLDNITVPDFYPDVEEIKSCLADYAVEIEYGDSHLGKILDLLEEKGELDNTLILATSDNGMPLPRAKATCYDYGTRMPLAIRWGEKIIPGRIVEDFVSFTDFAPTFLQAAGIAPLEQMTGKSLIPVLLSEKSGQIDTTRDHAIMGVERHFPGGREKGLGYPIRAIRTKDYLYIKNDAPARWPVGDPDGKSWPPNPKYGFGDVDNSVIKEFLIDNRQKYPKYYQWAFGKRPAEELYVISSDPYQLHNVADDPKFNEIKQHLAKRMKTELKKTADPRETGNGEVLDNYAIKYTSTV
jgi:uncharacterized sulfatase